MCGICGFTGPANEPLLRGMTASLVHRGPDEDGFFSDGANVSLGMRRLKVIDLATGSQPISNEDGTVTVVFNGEIYNFKELRAELEGKGHRFRTNTDTETLVHLYEEHGEEFPKFLRGMFAFALWDAKERKLLLARDQFGIKPLYYARRGGRLYFASELKALRLVSGVCGELEPLAIDHFFTYLYIPAPFSIYKGAKKLEPASTLVFRDGSTRVEKYWRLHPSAEAGRPEEYYVAGIRDLLSKAVKEQLVSDVPLGLLLSGGVDSASLLAFMAEHSGAGVKAFTASFDEDTFDELPAARAAARHFGAEHVGIPVKPDISAVIRKLAGHFDEPFADSSALANYLVTKEARRGVTVALAGVGGDEMFSGYPRHLGARLLPEYLKLPKGLRGFAGLAASFVPESRSSSNLPGRLKRFLMSGSGDFGRAYDSWISYLGQDEKRFLYSGRMAAALAGGGAVLPGLPRDPAGIFRFELDTYLPDDLLCLSDRASMANSLELRVPFMDVRLAEFMAGVPLELKTKGFKLKYLLKKAMADKLPPEVMKGPKRGFQVPLARWQEKELKAFTAEVLSPANLDAAGVLSRRGLAKLMQEHASGRRNRYDLIYAATVFHLWMEHARHNPPAAISGVWNVEGRRKILLVNLAGLGDIVMMTPALRAIRAAYPDARVELLTIDRSADLAAGLEGVDKVHSVPIRYRFTGPAGALKLLRTLAALRREKFDALVNFSLISSYAGLLKARAINFAVKAGVSSCRALAGLGSAGDFTCFEEDIERKSSPELAARLLAPLGLEPRDHEITYSPGLEEKKKVAMDIAARGISGRPLIGLNPGAFRPSRRWPVTHWKELIGKLADKYPGAAIVVTGSPSETALCGELKVSDRVFNAAGLYTVRENAALYQLFDLFITNDTGPMHIAAAVGAKTVCIFGPGDHWRFAPSVPEARKRVVRVSSPGCDVPCYKFECPNPVCLTSVTPDDVLTAAKELLG